MSDLKLQITDEMKSAMKAKDKPRLNAIRLITSAIKQIEVDERIDVDDARVLGILDKMVKQRRDSIEQFKAGGRDELVKIEEFEIKLIQEFLPPMLSDDEVNTMLEAAIKETGASSMKEMGQVMAILKPKLQGRADMGAVSKKIKEQLG